MSGDPVALVTGGGSGIGLAVARSLFDTGFKVAICGRDSKKLAGAAGEILGDDEDGRERLFAAPADVSKGDDVRGWVEQARERLGEPSLLVNNAGIGSYGNVADLSESDWDRTMEINLKGVFLCTREVLPGMRARGGGFVINIASVSGKRGMAGLAAYCASKFAVIGFTESLAREEAAHGIRATSICPGYVDTPMVAGATVPAEEMIRPEDVASTVLYLISLSPKAAVREIVLERVGAL